MMMFIRDFVARHDMTLSYFFRMAHYKIFGKDHCGDTDAKAFLSCGDIPPYARKFIAQLQEEYNEVQVRQKYPRRDGNAVLQEPRSDVPCS